VSLLIVLIKTLWMKLFIYIHLSQEMNAWCNSSGVQDTLDNLKMVNSEYHIIHSMTLLGFFVFLILLMSGLVDVGFLCTP